MENSQHWFTLGKKNVNYEFINKNYYFCSLSFLKYGKRKRKTLNYLFKYYKIVSLIDTYNLINSKLLIDKYRSFFFKSLHFIIQ